MLKKEVCKECIKAAAVAESLIDPMTARKWAQVDDDDWWLGFVLCPFQGKVEIPKSQASRYCKRKAEHKRRKHGKG